eukprot:TRINITY_DN73984_c0_g1_i1.p1 TRINITY_DN73984_c0_g1~~TRINITY_DN73984_c0_g1_i1.p1  ORF type:complete len:574 (-),score=91.09 TRINITY_DN73984_c0_g1_i1:72-1793(-)
MERVREYNSEGLGTVDKAVLTGWRKTLASIVKSQLFDFVLVCIVLMNFVLFAYNTEIRARNIHSPLAVFAGHMFLLFYVTEIFVRIYVDRLRYFINAANVFDLCIVFADVVAEVVIFIDPQLVSFGWFRLFRIVRLLRLLLVIQRMEGFRELWLMLHGLISTIRAMAWACFLITLVLTVYSLIAIEFLKPLQMRLHGAGEYDGCEACIGAFDTVTKSFFTWFLLIFCGELWDDLVVPIVKAEPFTALLFFAGYVMINLGVMNLILTVIVDRASAARVDDEKLKREEKRQYFEKSRPKMYRWCEHMDLDKSGTVTLEELERGFESNDDFRAALAVLDLGVNDLRTVFNIIDEDMSGHVTYDEFVKQLHFIRTQESHTILVFINHYVQELRRKVSQQLELLNGAFSQRIDDHAMVMSKLIRYIELAEGTGIAPTPVHPAMHSSLSGFCSADNLHVAGRDFLAGNTACSQTETIVSALGDTAEIDLSGTLSGAKNDSPRQQETTQQFFAKESLLNASDDIVSCMLASARMTNTPSQTIQAAHELEETLELFDVRQDFSFFESEAAVGFGGPTLTEL